MKLISMTDFVLNINELVIKDYDQFFNSWQNKKLSIIENYANFLKQPLKPEMFVPCDENGNVLEEPIQKKYPLDTGNYCLAMGKYEEAKEKVLFEDFKYGYKWYETFIVMRDKISGKGQFQLSKYKNIEGLLNDDFDFNLTPTAIKQIGL